MVKVVLDIRESVDTNARRYFEAAKKARHKAKGAAETVERWKAKSAEELAAVEAKAAAPKTPVVKRKKEWFEKFRWCFASDGTLLIGGRDATSNEVVVKKHTEPVDVVFHTDMAGSPFVIVKTEGKEVSAATLEEAAQFCAAYSRAWRNGLSMLEVFHVKPEQVSKEANTGEFLPKGAFMIRGKTLYHNALIAITLGLDAEGRIMAGPSSAVKKRCERSVDLLPGNEKASDVAKLVQKMLGGGELDEIIAALPAGGCKIAKRK